MLDLDEAIKTQKVAGEDTFPFLKLALERASQNHNVVIVTSSIASAWLFTCILQKKLGRSTPLPPFFQRDLTGYEMKVASAPDGPFYHDRHGYLALLPRKQAKKTFTVSDGYNISDVFVEKRKGYGRMSLIEWQESEGIVKRCPANRFERLAESNKSIDNRRTNLRDYPKGTWMQVERRGYKRTITVKVVSRTFYFDGETVEDARGRTFHIKHRDVLSVVEVPPPVNAV